MTNLYLNGPSQNSSMSKVFLSCFAGDEAPSDHDEDLLKAKSQQSSIFNRFSAKRGAGRIERYFVKMRYYQADMAITLVSFIIFLAMIVVFVYLQDNNYRRYLQNHLDHTMTSTQILTFVQTKNIFHETQFYSNSMAALFSNTPIFPISLENSVQITQIQLKAFWSALSHSSFVHDCGFLTGSVVSVEIQNNSLDNILLYYGDATPDNERPLLNWRAGANGANSSFPNSNGEIVADPFTTTSRIWFQYGVSRNKTTWTSIYYGIFDNSMTIPVISCASPSRFYNGSISAILSSEIDLYHALDMFTNLMPGNNSRFAVISETGTLLTATGSDIPIDFYRGNIVTKTIWELRDPIWREVTAHMNGTLSNFSAEIPINGETRHYTVNVKNFSMGDDVQWRFLSAISTNDIISIEFLDPYASYIVSIVLSIFAWIIAIVFNSLFDYLIGLEQNRLNANDLKKSKHLKKIGIRMALISLNNLMRSHADNPIVMDEIQKIQLELRSEHDSIYFSSTRFYNLIKSAKVRNKFIKLYGQNQQPNEIFNGFSSVISSKANSFSSTQSKGSNRSPGSFPFSSVVNNSFIRRKNALELSKEQSIDAIKVMMSKYNTILSTFDDDELDSILSGILDNFDAQIINLCADSIEFILINLQWKVQELLYSNEFAFALMIASLIWHASMRNRRSKKQLIKRYCLLNNSKIIKMSQFILSALYPALNTQNEESENQWKRLVEIIHELILISNVKFHVWTLVRTDLFIKTIDFFKPRNEKESLDICRVLYVASTYSFVFHDKENSLKAQKIINPDYKINEIKISSFFKCWNAEYKEYLVVILGDICGKRFINRFFEE